MDSKLHLVRAASVLFVCVLALISGQGRMAVAQNKGTVAADVYVSYTALPESAFQPGSRSQIFEQLTLKATANSPMLGLAVVLALHWYDVERPYSDSTSAKLFVKTAETILASPEVGRMFIFSTYDSSPGLQTELLKALAHVHWSLGNKEASRRYFHRLVERTDISINTKAAEGRAADEQWIIDLWADYERSINLDWLSLKRGRIASEHGKEDLAYEYLDSAFNSDNPDVSTRAALRLFDHVRTTYSDSNELAKEQYRILSLALEAAYSPAIRRQILIKRSQACARGNLGCTFSDISAAVEVTPPGEYTDDALLELAQWYFLHGKDGEAIATYRRLQDLEFDNDRRDSAAYRPALMLIQKGTPDSLQAAKEILEKYLTYGTEPTVTQLARFWLGRIAERQMDSAGASRHFQTLVKEDPISYYGLRAAMHLEMGSNAANNLLPGDKIIQQLSVYFTPAPSPGCADGEVGRRITAIASADIYRSSLKALQTARTNRELFRLATFDWSELKSRQGYRDWLVLLSIRQDMVSFTDVATSHQALVNCASVALDAGDFRLASDIADARFNPEISRSTLSRTAGYMLVTRPEVYVLPLKGLGGEGSKLTPEFYYALADIESSLDAQAINRSGHVGLFQFGGPALRNLMKEGLIEEEPVQQAKFRMFDVQYSFDVVGQWFKELLSKDVSPRLQFFENPQEIEPLLYATAHRSGRGKMRTLVREVWSKPCCRADLELLVENGNSSGLRIYLRKLMLEIPIAHASGYFAD